MIQVRVPRLAVAGLSGDSGKTLVSLGLTRALSDRGMAVQTYKKGPDYIDAAWLAAASGRPCRNLDTFLMAEGAIGRSLAAAGAADLLLVEGNRGLYDGVDARGGHSTAELAKLLAAPVVLVVPVTKVTRTVAAFVIGCRELDPDVQLAGVVLNRVATARQERVVREAVEATGVPVLGAIPRLGGDDPLPGRHLGLVTAAEHPQREEAIRSVTEVVKKNVDLDAVLEAAATAPVVELAVDEPRAGTSKVKVAYVADEAFSFYYPENLEGLEEAGAHVVPISPSGGDALGETDGLYIGGGFPEVHASRLAESGEFGESLRARVADGLPVYAECGGLMYLARELVVDGATFPMAGVLDLVVEQQQRPQGHGYEVASVDRDNPFYPTGDRIEGHEFHYSRVVAGDDQQRTALRVDRGQGTGGGRDGIVKDGVWASYLHVHAGGTTNWADGFLGLACRYAAGRVRSETAWV